METNKKSEFIYKCLKNPELLRELKQNPKKVIEREWNIKLPENYRLEVLEETPEKGYLIIPLADKIQEFSDEELKSFAGGAGTFFNGIC